MGKTPDISPILVEREPFRVCLPPLRPSLSSVTRVFTKIMKPVVGLLRLLGIRVIVYLVNLLIMAEYPELARSHVNPALNLFEGLGFSVNYEKSVLVTTTSIEFLGFSVDSINLSLSLPRDMVKKVRKECQQLLDNPTSTIQEFSRLLGHLTSSIQAVFPASSGVSTGGQRSPQEQMLHINFPELLAGAFAVKIFAETKHK